jgi:dTMP kinase
VNARRGHFVAFEGGEGSGKSTQAALLAEALGAVLTREPGGTTLGARIRELVLSPSSGEVDPRAEALLMAADRAQHVAEVVEPALAAGHHVVTDRFAGSSIAYQGYGRGLPVAEVEGLSRWATAGCWPDLVVLLDVAPEVADRRLQRALDRMEAAGAEFHRRVNDGFRALAAAEPDRWVLVDGSGPVDVVQRAVADVVGERLQLPV